LKKDNYEYPGAYLIDKTMQKIVQIYPKLNLTHPTALISGDLPSLREERGRGWVEWSPIRI